MPNYVDDIKYVNSLLPCEVIANTDNIDMLIANSAIVIASPSTLALKSIQVGIPTILINGSGAIGIFKDYPGLVNLNRLEIIQSLHEQIDHGRYENFIKTHINGGIDFTSTFEYVKHINTIIYGNSL
jgi:hypothetical protein